MQGVQGCPAAGAQLAAPFARGRRPIAASGRGLPRACGRGRVLAAHASRELPLFPLNIVALPSTQVPLHIFEARYRILFNTLLKGDANVDAELVDDSSPFAGTRRFGMCLASSAGLATVGCELEVHTHEQLPDGRLLVVSKGTQRFRITRILKEKPYLVAEVDDFPDDADVRLSAEDEPLGALGNEVRQLYVDTLRLSTKSRGMPFEEPEDIKELDAAALSFWVPNGFRDALQEQQQLLEMPNARARLNREREILRETLKYLSATLALKSALGDIESGASSAAAPDAATPDAAAAEDAAPEEGGSGGGGGEGGGRSR